MTAPAKLTPAIHRTRVLVIDDEPLVVEILRRALRREHDVEGYTNPTHAVERVMFGERFDAIVCDVSMPELTGMDIHAVLSRHCSEQADRMVFVTGGATTAAASTFLDNVPNHKLYKPFDVGAVQALVRSLVEGKAAALRETKGSGEESEDELRERPTRRSGRGWLIVGAECAAGADISEEDTRLELSPAAAAPP